MSEKSIEEKVKDIIVEQLGVNPEQVTPTASFIEDLGADSLDIVELVMAFEEEFSVEVPDEDAEKLQTVGDVIKYIEEEREAISRPHLISTTRPRFACALRRNTAAAVFSCCRVAVPSQARQTNEAMNFAFLSGRCSTSAGHYISLLGLIAFVALFAAGLVIASVAPKRRGPAASSADSSSITNFTAIVTTILSVAALVFFTVSAINAAGIPLSWNAPLPGISLSLSRFFCSLRCSSRSFGFPRARSVFSSIAFSSNSGLDRSLQYAIAQIVSNLVLVIGIFIVLENTGIHLGALTVFAGAVGVGVGFGLQNIASNFISGLVILAERPITIGDRVEVAGIIGQVQQIRARSTVILTNDNIAMIVPNTKFIDSPVTNWTYGDPRVRFRIPVGVAYGSDVKKVREALIAAGAENPHTSE